MSDEEKFTIEVNGQVLNAQPGQMLIEVTDTADIYIPRFCYHKKLTVAANCRMCLVEVENAPKPLPACATPVSNGMKVFTKSAAAIDAQKSVMEFLLINHPLDCPICDQGGECELQDIAMGYGRGISRFNERKRVVKDKDIGPLISTDMTRCIHCTRCVRFTEEVQGYQELGTLGRGDQMEIGTYIEQGVNHELSGNIIDLCPVGALNNKPYRFSARAWEMVSLPTIAPHDCIGSNLNAHVVQGRVKRVVPRFNDDVNESWIADRDRFSCEGIYADDRLQTPIIRDDGEWREASWEEALDVAAEGLRRSGADLGVLVSPNTTSEEGYLLNRITRHLGSNNIDYRLRRRDFRQQELDPRRPVLGMQLEDIERADAILVVGSNLRKEVPLLAHRVRKAAVAGGHVAFINQLHYHCHFPLGAYLQNYDLLEELDALVHVAGGAGPAVDVTDEHRRVVQALRDGGASTIIVGQIAMRHPRFAEIDQLITELARLTGASHGYAPEGANAVGLSEAGVLPHRGVGFKPQAQPGANVAEMLARPPKGLLLFGVEPEFDCADGQAGRDAMRAAQFVVAFSPWLGNGLNEHADVVLPMGTFAETSGTFVNVNCKPQSFGGIAQPVGECRPGWKILRVLGNLLELPDCEYSTSDEVVRELVRVAKVALDEQPAVAPARDESTPAPTPPVAAGDEVEPAELDVPIYQTDALVRRSHSLQMTRDGQAMRVAERKTA